MRRWQAYSDRAPRRSLHRSRDHQHYRYRKSRERQHIRHHSGYRVSCPHRQYFVDWRKQNVYRSSHQHRRHHYQPHYRSHRYEKPHYKQPEREEIPRHHLPPPPLPISRPASPPHYAKLPKIRSPPVRTAPVLKQRSESESEQKSLESEGNLREINEAVFLSDDGKKDRSKDAGHFEWSRNELLGDRYKVIKFLGDGTFGRCLECLNSEDRRYYAVKVIRSVERYLDAAKDEIKILEKLKSFDKFGTARIAYLKESFSFTKKKSPHLAMVFQRLGPSVYDAIKSNHYYGLTIEKVRAYARDMLEALTFLHAHHLTHTDLKVSRPHLSLKISYSTAMDAGLFHLMKSLCQQSYKKVKGSPKPSPLRNIAGSCKDEQELDAFPQNTNYPFNYYRSPLAEHVKIIDFGGATFQQNYHSTTINTRQYRAPEVILRCQRWNEKSDIWSAACVIIEMYTGQLFFPTHENYEHLAMMEAQLGPIPLAMVLECHETMKGFFNIDLKEKEIQKKGHRVNWPRFCKNDESYEAVKNFLKLKTLIHEEHSDLLELLEYMFKFDPRVRPSAEECLMQRFFNPRKSIALSSTASHSKSKH